MDFFVRIIEALVWPVAVIWLGILFRAELRSLFGRMSSLKYKELEAKFEKSLDEAENLAAEAVPQRIPDEEPIYPEGYADTYEQLLRIADESPRAALVEARINVENSLADALESLGVARERRPNRIGQRLWELAKDGRVSKQTARLFDELRQLGNEAAHARDFVPPQRQVRRYLQLAVELSLTLKHLAKTGQGY